VNFAVGADSTYVIKPADLAAGNEASEAIRLRERPELNVDDQGIRLIDTGSLNANHLWSYGLEATGNWHSLYGQGGYFHFGVVRGGEQRIWTAGLNWYPNNAIRLLLDYEHTDVSRLDSAGGNLDARLDAVSLRAQVAF